MAKYEIRRNRLSRRWRVVLIADNNEILSTSEGLNTLAAAHVNIASQRKAAPDAPVTEK